MISVVVNGQADEIANTLLYGLARFAFLGTVLYYFYIGNKLAKWLIVISTLVYGVLGFLSTLLGIVVLLLASNISFIVKDSINLTIYIICIAIGVVLIKSSPVNDFLTYQREELKKEINDYESES